MAITKLSGICHSWSEHFDIVIDKHRMLNTKINVNECNSVFLHLKALVTKA